MLDNRPVPRAQPGERSVTAVARMAERFLTREVSGVTVLVTLGRTSGAAVTDSEGYFSVGLPVDNTVSVADGRVGAQATIDGVGDDIWLIEGFVVGRDTSRIVISDVDDTLLLNGSGDVLRTVWNTAAGTALTRRPVPGTPELYRHLVAATDSRAKCPIFYVSSSPWNIYDFLIAFLNHRKFPAGPLALRDFGMNRATLGGAHGSHKRDRITEILSRVPDASVVLVGDSSQQDAEAFAEIIKVHERRIVGAFIRDVGDTEKADAVQEIADSIAEVAIDGGPLMSLVEDMDEIVPHLQSVGWFD